MRQKTITEQEFRTVVERLGHVEQSTGNEPSGYETQRVKYTHWGEYVYYADFVVSFGARASRPGDGVTVARLWADDELIYDRRAGFIKPQIGFTFFDGNENQGEVYRGMHYRGQMVGRFIDFRLTDYGNNIPTITAELVDGDGAAIADAVGAFQPIMTTGAYVQLDTERDIMFTAGQYTLRPDMIHYRTGYAGLTESWNLAATEARLSTKAVYRYNAVLGVLGAALEDTYYEGGTLTWLPEINLLVAQPAQGSRQFKRLVNLNEKFAPTIAEVELTTEWDMAIKLVVRHGNQTFYFVVGASETNVAPVAVEDGTIYPVSEVETTGDNRCLVAGKQRPGVTEYYVIQTAEVLRCGQWFHGGSDSTVTLYTPPSGHTLTQGWYDKANDRLIVLVESDAVAHTGYAVAINADGSVAWESDPIRVPVKTPRHYTQESYSDVSQGSVVIVRQDDATKLTYLHLASGDVSEVTLFSPPATFPLNQTAVWDSRTETLYSGAQSFVQLGTPPAPGNQNSLTAGEVMAAYAVHVGFDPENISLVNMDGLFIQGYVVSGDTTLGQLATNLGNLYGFNWVERNSEIIFKSIYTDQGEIVIDETIPANRLAVLTEGNPDYLTVRRETPLDTAPSVLSLTYFDPDNQLRPGMQVAERDSSVQDRRVDLSYPLTINGQYAVELLFGYMARIWSSTTGYDIRLPAEGIVLDPIDVIEFTANGFEYTAQVTRHRVNADYSVTLSAVAATAKYPMPAEAQPPRVIPSTGLYPPRVTILDAPLTTPLDEREGYVRVLAFVSGINGAPLGPTILEMAYSTGGAPVEWEPRATLGSEDAGNVGTLVMPVGPTDDPFTLDTFNEIFVEQESIDPAKFVPATDADLDNGANLIAIGSGAEVEYVQFKSAQEVEPGVWRLYNLRRGRFGTEVFIYVGAQAGSIPVTFIDDKAIILEFPYADVAAGNAYQFRAYSPGQPLWQVETVTHTPVGNSRRAYAPAIIEGFVEDNDDLRITWKRRARYTNLPPLPVEALPFPLDEPVEEYSVELYDADTGAFIGRFDDISTQEFVWPALDQSFAGYTPGDIERLGVRVIQISPISGDGFSALFSVDFVPANAVLMVSRFALGGEMSIGTINYITLAATYDLGGETRGHIYPPVRLSTTFSLEGGMAADLFGPVNLAAHMSLGGEITADMNPVPLRLGAVFDLEGSMSGNVSGLGEHRAEFSLGGGMAADILASVKLGAGFALGGAMVGEIEEVVPPASTASFEVMWSLEASLNSVTRQYAVPLGDAAEDREFFIVIEWGWGSNSGNRPSINSFAGVIPTAIYTSTSDNNGAIIYRVSLPEGEGKGELELQTNGNTMFSVAVLRVTGINGEVAVIATPMDTPANVNSLVVPTPAEGIVVGGLFGRYGGSPSMWYGHTDMPWRISGGVPTSTTFTSNLDLRYEYVDGSQPNYTIGTVKDSNFLTNIQWQIFGLFIPTDGKPAVKPSVNPATVIGGGWIVSNSTGVTLNSRGHWEADDELVLAVVYVAPTLTINVEKQGFQLISVTPLPSTSMKLAIYRARISDLVNNILPYGQTVTVQVIPSTTTAIGASATVVRGIAGGKPYLVGDLKYEITGPNNPWGEVPDYTGPAERTSVALLLGGGSATRGTNDHILPDGYDPYYQVDNFALVAHGYATEGETLLGGPWRLNTTTTKSNIAAIMSYAGYNLNDGLPIDTGGGSGDNDTPQDVDIGSGVNPLPITSTTSTTITIPADVNVGDLLVVSVLHRGDLTVPAGWSLAGTSPVTASFNQRTSIIYKFVATGDAGSGVTITQSVSERLVVNLQAYGNIDDTIAPTVLHSASVEGGNSWAASTGVIDDYSLVVGAVSFLTTSGSTTLTDILGALTDVTPLSRTDNRLYAGYRNTTPGDGFNVNVTTSVADTSNTGLLVAFKVKTTTMVPTVIGSSYAVSSGGTVTVDKPAGLAVGDMMIVQGQLKMSPGWQSAIGYPTPYGALQYKFATADDVAASNFSFDTIDNDAWIISLVAVRDAAGPMDWKFQMAPQFVNSVTNTHNVGGPSRLLLGFGLAGSTASPPTALGITSPDLTELVSHTIMRADYPQNERDWSVFVGSKVVGQGEQSATAQLTTPAVDKGIMLQTLLIRGKPAP